MKNTTMNKTHNLVEHFLQSSIKTNSKIFEVKLKSLLEYRKKCSSKEEITTLYPPTEIGSITLVDQIVLLSLCEIIMPKLVVEIGTYLGYTTYLLCKNITSAKIISVDLPKFEDHHRKFDHQKILNDGNYNDESLREQQNTKGEVYLNNLTEEEKHRVKLIKKDSRLLDMKAEIGELDFIFIDGGHDYDTIKSDTEMALKNMKEGIIVWHDFSSSIHSDVTKYLSEISESMTIFSVSGSLCAFTCL